MKNAAMTVLAIITSLIFNSHPALSHSKKQKNIRIAILDSGFCPDLLQKPKTVKVNLVWFAVESSFDLKCSPENLTSPRFHGHKVLQLLLEDWDLVQNSHSVTLTIDPIIMLDEKGFQSLTTWKKTLKKITDEKYDIVLSSIGFAFANSIEFEKANLALPEGPTYFFAAGEKIGRLARAEIFPQKLATLQKSSEKIKKIHLVGLHFFDGKKWVKQPTTFYLDSVTDWTSDDPRPEFKGSSLAAPRTLIRWIRSEHFSL